MSITKLTLEEVEETFANWRKIRTNGELVPVELWEQVKVLLKSYKRGKVLNKLGISTKQARDKGLFLSTDVAQYEEHINKSSCQFIKIPLESALPNVTPNTYNLTLARGDTKLSINNPPSEHVQLIINLVLR